MEWIEINDQKSWNTFVVTHGPKSGAFLQSWEWGEFQKKFGRKIWRLGALENENLTAVTLIIKHNLPFGKSYLYCPRGPIVSIKYLVSGIWYEKFLKEIVHLAKKEKSIFFRFEPINNKSQILNTKYKIQNTAPIQPLHTLTLDLTKSDEELLSSMHPKTRYNIRLAERHGITVHRTRFTDPEMLKDDFEIFWPLLQKTAGRDGFNLHPKNYYWQMLNILIPQPCDDVPRPNVALYLAKYQNKILGANLMMFFGDTVTYLHGASSDEHRNVMAPHLLHWQIIREAKRLGYEYYDFWGIDEQRWPGITRFKKGFANEASPDRSPDASIGTSVGSGHIIEFPGTFDLPIQKNWYKIYRLAKKFFNLRL